MARPLCSCAPGRCARSPARPIVRRVTISVARWSNLVAIVLPMTWIDRFEVDLVDMVREAHTPDDRRPANVGYGHPAHTTVCGG